MISHQSHGEGPISLVLLSFLTNEGKTVSGDRVSSWAAAVVVDRFYGTCPLGDVFGQEIQPTPLAEWNEIPIAVCSIAIVVVVWPAVGLCFSSKDIFVHVVCCDICKPPSTHCAFYSGRRCTRNMSR